MSQATAPISHPDRFYLGGQWVAPSSAATIQVIDSGTEQVYFTVPEAQAADIDRAVAAAREAFDSGPWPWLTPAQRAGRLRALGAELGKRTEAVGEIWPREAGVLHAEARLGGTGAERTFNGYADLAASYPFEEPARPPAGEFGLLLREPVGVVGAIIPWNVPIRLISNKVAPALLAGCTVVLKSAPEALGEGYLLAEAAEAAFSQVRVGDPFSESAQTVPLAAERQRDRVEGYIAKGIADGATLATAAAGRRTWTAAGTSSRPCSATSTTTPPSPRRRSSARCCR